MVFLEFDCVRVVFVITDDRGNVISVLDPVAPDRKPLARAVLSLPAVVRFLASRNWKQFQFRGRVKGLQLSPIAWAFYGELKAQDLIDSREEAVRLAREMGVEIPPRPEARYEKVDLSAFSDASASATASPSPDKSPFA